MSALNGRAAAPARPLLYLAGADGIVFLLATLAALLPLLHLNGPFPWALEWTSAVLAAAAVCGLLGGIFLRATSPAPSRALLAAVANATLILIVAVYFSTALEVFGGVGPVLLVLAVPALAAAWMLRPVPTP